MPMRSAPVTSMDDRGLHAAPRDLLADAGEERDQQPEQTLVARRRRDERDHALAIQHGLFPLTLQQRDERDENRESDQRLRCGGHASRKELDHFAPRDEDGDRREHDELREGAEVEGDAVGRGGEAEDRVARAQRDDRHDDAEENEMQPAEEHPLSVSRFCRARDAWLGAPFRSACGCRMRRDRGRRPFAAP